MVPSLSPSLGIAGGGGTDHFLGGGVGWGARWQSPRRDCALPAAREAPWATSVNATPPAPGPAPGPGPAPRRPAPAREACAAAAASERERDGC